MNVRHAMIFSVILGITPSLRGQVDTSEQFVKAALERIAQLERRLELLEGARPDAGSITPVSGLPSSSGVHVVQEGETLLGIARQNHVSVVELEKANRLLPGATIRQGDQLLIPPGTGAQPTEAPVPPAPAPSKVPIAAKAPGWDGTHIIREGETLSSIARTYGTTSMELVRRNAIQDANLIRVGQQLRVPDGVSPSQTTATAPPVSTPPSASPSTPQEEETYHYYDVMDGDTLVSVAATFYSTPEEIARLNNIGPGAVLQVGQQLVVPTRRYFAEKKKQSGMS
jgi:lysozyme